jgi:hypothetical protein
LSNNFHVSLQKQQYYKICFLKKKDENKLPFYLARREGQPAPSFVAVPNGIVHS